MRDNSQYYWVVLCKNHRFHKHQNLFFGHRIPLGETDALLPPPPVPGDLRVRCDECGQEYSYHPKDVMRVEFDPPDSFMPHPLFQ